ncbi:c-type cytochrome [Alteromonas halophila]|uniref:c-type cytochrome n=1 Tax=Alteromonas halophila TaxID=516698 RepID=UPI0027E548D9|nr:c-type cytochrome [Alteromonas halophila]
MINITFRRGDNTMRLALFLMISGFTLTACQWGADSPHGFSLPEGNAEAGKALFTEYGCVDCHAVKGIDATQREAYRLSQPIVLGGKNTRVKTYAELVTSIINPSHKLSRRYPVSLTSKDGESRMPNMNDVLTVSDLIDIVAFLQPKYEVVPYRTSEYRLYQLRIPDEKARD